MGDDELDALAQLVADKIGPPATGTVLMTTKQPNPVLKWLLETRLGQGIITAVVVFFFGGGVFGGFRTFVPQEATAAPVPDEKHQEDHRQLETDMSIVHRQMTISTVERKETAKEVAKISDQMDLLIQNLGRSDR